MRWSYYLGVPVRGKGDIVNATVAFERALQSAPNDAPTMMWLGEEHLDQGRTNVAELTLRESTVPSASLGRGVVWSRTRGVGAEGLRSGRATSRTGAGARQHGISHPLFVGHGLPWPGDQRRAESHLQQRGTLQIRPDPLRKELDELLHSALTYEKNADVAGARGDWAEATEYLRKAVTLAPTRASPHHKLGTALFYRR